MKALSIRQPWAFFILCDRPYWKRYENREWNRSYAEGQFTLCPPGSDFLIHAAKGMTKKEYDEACAFAVKAGVTLLPRFDDLKRGGIVGMAKFVRAVTFSCNPWFTGPVGLELDNPYPLPFEPCQGSLGFFDPELPPQREYHKLYEANSARTQIA